MTRGKFRIYIIDEVHMLSNASFNASANIDRIAGLEGATLEAGVAGLVARAAEGSMRDALSMLDQANRLVSADAETVAFRWKDYRIKHGDRQKVMRLATDEFIRRFLIHVLPDGFHRIRHYGLLASAARKANIAKIRDPARGGAARARHRRDRAAEPIPLTLREPCPCCGGPMRIIEIFRRGQKAAITGTAAGAGRMMERPSLMPDPSPVPIRAPAWRRLSRAARAAQMVGSIVDPARAHRQLSTKATVARSHHASGLALIAMAAPTVGALSP